MTKTDKTFRDLGQLYEFYREIRKAELRRSCPTEKPVQVARGKGGRRGPTPGV